MLEQEIQQLNCPICMVMFKRPVTLSCGHTFCSFCLGNALRQHKNCPVCRHHVSNGIGKMRFDECIDKLVTDYRKIIKKLQNPSKKVNNYVQCKAQRLLLIDIVSNDLLLPFNKITATFQLQSDLLKDRLQRFVARQQSPYNKYSVVCKINHIEQIRKNLFRGVLYGYAFCSIQTEEVESQLSLELEEQQYFYRTCKCKEISEVAEMNPSEFQTFIECFERIQDDLIRKNVQKKIDCTVFTKRTDPIAIYYSILGIVNISNEKKYETAITFNEQQRIKLLKDFISHNKQKLLQKPSTLINIPSQTSNTEKAAVAFILILILLALFTRSNDL